MGMVSWERKPALPGSWSVNLGITTCLLVLLSTLRLYTIPASYFSRFCALSCVSVSFYYPRVQL